MFRSKVVIAAGIIVVVLLGGCSNNGKKPPKSTTTRPVDESTTTTVKRPDPGTPLGMFCASFEKYLAESAKPAAKSKSELEQSVKDARAILGEVADRALPDIAQDAKKLRDGTFAYWDALAKVGYDAVKLSDEVKLRFLEDTASARTNLERFGAGTCGIVTTTTSSTVPAKK